MKHLSLILNGILAVAVVVLFILHFSDSNKESNSTEIAEEAASLIGKEFTIAFINSDSLVDNLEFLKDQQKNLEVKSEQMNQTFRSRVERLQREIETFQRDAQTMTMAKARSTEEELMKKQQNLQMYEQSLTQELMREQEKVTNELYTLLTDYLKDYGQKNEIQMVFKYDRSSDLLFAKDSMDITKVVVNDLNQKYASDKIEETETEVKE